MFSYKLGEVRVSYSPKPAHLVFRAHCRIAVHQAAPNGPRDHSRASIEACETMHPTPRDAPDPPQSDIAGTTLPAVPPWDTGRHLGTKSGHTGHSAALKGANGTAWPGFPGLADPPKLRFPTGTSNAVADSASAAARTPGCARAENVAAGVRSGSCASMSLPWRRVESWSHGHAFFSCLWARRYCR